MLMLPRIFLGLIVLWTAPVWSQIESIPFEMPSRPSDEDRMLTPPPASGEAYPTTVGSQARSNYLAAGLTFIGAYDDNVIVGSGAAPIGDGIYSILPTIALNQTTPRRLLTLQLSPGFTFYQKTTELNAAYQTAALNFQYRLSQHATIILSDSFQKSSNVFDQLHPLSGGAPSGSTQSSQGEVVAPYANQLTNAGNALLSYQISRNGMIGVSGTFAESNYLDSTQASGLSNSNSLGGAAFYNHRLSSTQYIGVTYQYSSSQANPVNGQTIPVNAQVEVHTQTILAFDTIYFNPSLSLSLSAGPQYFDATESPLPRVTSWTPSIKVDVRWQRSHTNFVASYLRSITGTTGLLGVFDSNSANASASWQMARTWIATMAAGYTVSKSATPSIYSSDPGGHSLSGAISGQHLLGEHLTAEFGYARLHQSYEGVGAIAANPDSNREYISVSYRLARPLGR
jgi:hypothetical protein